MITVFEPEAGEINIAFKIVEYNFSHKNTKIGSDPKEPKSSSPECSESTGFPG